MNKKILAVLALAASLAVRAEASVAISSASTTGVLLIGAQTAYPKAGTVIKAIRLCNDYTLNACVLIKDAGGTVVLPLCASAQSCNNGMQETSTGQNLGAAPGAIQGWSGEVLTSTTSLTVYTSSDSAKLYIQAWYTQPFK